MSGQSSGQNRIGKARSTRWKITCDIARKRDGFRCVAERFSAPSSWRQCGSGQFLQTAHIFKRSDLGDYWDCIDFVARICWRCHRDMHDHMPAVRLPKERIERAWKRIVELHQSGDLKVLPKRP
jgi:hypothetical protein